MTASIIAVLQLTSTLTSYLNDVRNATKEQAEMAVEASNLYTLLTNLRFRVEGARSDGAWFTHVRALAVRNGPLDQFKDVLENIVEHISPSRKRDRALSALVWRFTKKEVDTALQKIERLKSLVNYALANDLL
jgi:hypothetical protein